jgi:hypothetical protein
MKNEISAVGKRTAEKLLRFLFAAFCVATFVTAVFFAFKDPFSILLFVPTTVGFIMSIVAGGGLQVAHYRDRRSIIEIFLLGAFPFLNYFLLFLTIDATSKEVWVFCGFYLFCLVTGGFLLGILTIPFGPENPRFARLHPFDIIKAGFRFIKEIKLAGFAVFVFIGTAAAVVVFGAELVKIAGKASVFQQTMFYLLFFPALFFVIRFTRRHTILGAAHAGSAGSDRENYGME